MSLKDPNLEPIVQDLRSKFSCHTFILYGSRARGDAKETSDYDILGITEKGDEVIRDARLWNGFYLDAFIYRAPMILKNFLATLISGVLLLGLGNGLAKSAYGGLPDAESCTFYLDLEKKWQCFEKPGDSSDYLVFYGYKYCSKFLHARKDWTPAAKEWAADTSLCLQRKLAAAPSSTCQGLEQFALDSHPECYLKAGFCRLTGAERKDIARLLACWDVLKKRAFEQVMIVMSECVEDLGLGDLSSDAICPIQ